MPEAFSEWVRDRRGRFWVACIDDRVVGFAKLSIVGDREAWLHGLRVDPRFHRRGVAGKLLDHRLRRARALGARVARLDTGDDNPVVKRMAAHRGFHLTGRIGHFGARARRGDLPARADPARVAALWRLTRKSDGLFHDVYARRAIARADLTRAIRDGTCLATSVRGRPAALVIVKRTPERIGVAHMAGNGAPLAALLRQLRAFAERSRVPRVAIAAQSATWPALRAAGYARRWDGAMVIFEKRLR